MKQFAGIMAIITTIAIGAILVVGPAIWLFFLTPLLGMMGPEFTGAELTLSHKVLGMSVALFGGAIRAYGLLGLRRTFLEARKGTPLSMPSVHGFRRFARVEVAMVFVTVVQTSLFGAILTSATPNAQGALSIQFGTGQLASLFMAVLLMFAAEVMAEGHKSAEENASFL